MCRMEGREKDCIRLRLCLGNLQTKEEERAQVAIREGPLVSGGVPTLTGSFIPVWYLHIVYIYLVASCLE